MKRISILNAALALLRLGDAALQGHRYGDYGGQLVYQGPNEGRNSDFEKSEPPKTPNDIDKDMPEDAGSTSPHFISDEDTSRIIPPTDLDHLPSNQENLPINAQTHQSAFGAKFGRNQWAIVYFPYNDDSTCKTLLSVRSDIAAIARKGFSSVRLHANDCNALYKVGAAAALHDMKMIIGVHVDDIGGLEEADTQIKDIIAWATSPKHPNSRTTDPTNPTAQSDDKWHMVEMVVIGEEVILNEYLAPTALASLIIRSRTHLRLAGYTGPVTTIESIPTLEGYADLLCPVLDLPASNIHPFFHSDVSAENAGAYVRDSLEVLEGICPGMEGKAVNLETGWPSRGDRNGNAVPGRVEQMVAVEGVMRLAGRRSVVLGWGDDGWKDDGGWGVERAWGCEGLFGDV